MPRSTHAEPPIDDDDVSTVSTAPPSISPDGAVVSVLSGSAKGRSLRLPGGVGAAVTVGKASSNDLVIDDSTVSRRHLSFRRTAAGIEICDLESTNGTFVGSTRIKHALVEPGTLVRAGDVELLVAVETEDIVLPPSANESFGFAVAKSLEMRRIFGVLERIAPTSATVLLTGETGTGKDALARSIHLGSKRESGPFEVVDCGAVSASLIESELFGHERGAFTGAVASRAGAFERAAGGTVFLDEIGELSLDLQPKLLRVLEARELRRVGGQRTIAADVRIVAATTRDLLREVARGAFREDLYFRLAVVSVHVPPLRAHKDDIALLAERMLAASGAKLGIAADVVAQLRAYDWPGNVRELRNVVERGIHFSTASGQRTLKLVDFPPRGHSGDDDGALERMSFDEQATYRETRARFEAAFEKRFVRWLLERFDFNVSAAARAVKMDRNHLTDLARKHGVERRR